MYKTLIQQSHGCQRYLRLKMLYLRCIVHSTYQQLWYVKEINAVPWQIDHTATWSLYPKAKVSLLPGNHGPVVLLYRLQCILVVVNSKQTYSLVKDNLAPEFSLCSMFIISLGIIWGSSYLLQTVDEMHQGQHIW